MSNHQKQITEEIKQVIEEGANGVFKRAQSIRKRNNEGILNVSAENSGDILTKVTIPRSGSFLNAGGLTKYKSKVYRYELLLFGTKKMSELLLTKFSIFYNFL